MEGEVSEGWRRGVTQAITKGAEKNLEKRFVSFFCKVFVRKSPDPLQE